MKKISIFTGIIFSFLASVISSYGQSSATAAIGATMVTPISIAKNSDMSFGVLASSVTSRYFRNLYLEYWWYFNSTSQSGCRQL